MSSDLLGGRMARCPSCKTEVSSSPDLAFFEYRGEGSLTAKESCRHCGYHEVAHDPEHMRERVLRTTVVERGLCPGFEPRGPWDVDLFYCGCRGWD